MFSGFRGVHYISLDAKGRLAWPSRYRERLQEHCEGELVLTIHPSERCLLVYPRPEWEDIEERLTRLPGLNPTARRLQRLLIGHALECQLDGAGRILVTPPLREFAGMDRKTVLTGLGNKFELWDETTWSSSREQWLQENAADDSLSGELESLAL